MSEKKKTINASKALSVIVVVALLLSAIPLVAGSNDIVELTESFSFSAPEIVENGNFVDIEIDGTTSKTTTSRQPMLAKLSKGIELPFGAKVIDVNFKHSSMKTINLEEGKVISPSPTPVVMSPFFNNLREKLRSHFDLSEHKILQNIMFRLISRVTPEPLDYIGQNLDDTSSASILDESIYNSDKIYGEPFSYRLGTGLNKNNERVLFVVVDITPCTYHSVDGKLDYFTNGDVTIKYEMPQKTTANEDNEEYDLLIIAPRGYRRALLPLVEHKEEMGFKTKLVTLNEIYSEAYFEVPEDMKMRDDAERIKYFIYRSLFPTDLEEDPGFGVTYVLAVGGYRTFLGLNVPSKQFPVRMSHLDDGSEPGYTTDQYYSCCIDADGNFDTWDSNNNDIFAEWNFNGFDTYDPFPDVVFGRWAARNAIEVRNMVDKTIYYETRTFGEDWFNDVTVISGDGFQDQNDLAVEWDTNGLHGVYTIYAQSEISNTGSPNNGLLSKIDIIHNVTVDHSAPSEVTFGEDDHLQIEQLVEGQTNHVDIETLYPAKPVAEIVTPQENDILGNTNIDFNPSEAYCSDMTGWGQVQYIDGIMYIRAKSYDPTPHQTTMDTHSRTTLEVWVDDSDGNTIFGPINPEETSESWWEGEKIVQKGVSYLPQNFQVTNLFSSNGNWYNMSDVLTQFNNGGGFVFFEGHSNVMSWGDHLPAAPGGRSNGMVDGIAAINLKFSGLERYQGAEGDPLFPIETLENGYQLPIALISGCHSGQFDTSLIRLLSDPEDVLLGSGYGTWTPEGMAWWMARFADGGSIATIGNTGLGYGMLGSHCTEGLVGWIFPQLLYNYGIECIDILGDVHTQSLIDYSEQFDTISDQTDRKMFEEFVLLGDPTLKIGGYPEGKETSSQPPVKTGETVGPIISMKRSPDVINEPFMNKNGGIGTSGDIFKVTTNPYLDTSPRNIIRDESDNLIVGYVTEDGGDSIHPGFAMTTGGSLWNEIVYANPLDSGVTSIDSCGEEDDERYVGSICFDASTFGAIFMNDITNPYSWDTTRWYFGGGEIHTISKDGVKITPFVRGDSTEFGGMYTCIWEGNPAVMFSFSESNWVHGVMGSFHHISGDVDEVTGYHYWICEEKQGSNGFFIRGLPPAPGEDDGTFYPSGNIPLIYLRNSDVAAHDGWMYIVTEQGSGVIVRIHSNNGQTIVDTPYVTNNGGDPRILINDDGSLECYYTRNGNIYKSISNNHGITWTEVGITADIDDMDNLVYSPFAITEDAIVYAADDEDLYAVLDTQTMGAVIGDIEKAGNGVTTKITNSGTVYADMECKIDVIESSPVGKFFGGSPLLMKLFSGRIFVSYYTVKTIGLSPTESTTISSRSPIGIGHINVVVTVSVNGDILAEKSEDGFLFGSNILLYQEEE